MSSVQGHKLPSASTTTVAQQTQDTKPVNFEVKEKGLTEQERQNTVEFFYQEVSQGLGLLDSRLVAKVTPKLKDKHAFYAEMKRQNDYLDKELGKHIEKVKTLQAESIKRTLTIEEQKTVENALPDAKKLFYKLSRSKYDSLMKYLDQVERNPDAGDVIIEFWKEQEPTFVGRP